MVIPQSFTSLNWFLLVSAFLFTVTHGQSVQKAVCVLQGTQFRANLTGTVYFEQMDNSTTITATIKGLKPNASHGFHIHQYGSINKADGTGAGAHYNPFNSPHAYPNVTNRHVGDLGNLESDSTGIASFLLSGNNLTQLEGLNSIIGRGLIVHENPDDGVTQPTGNSGNRWGQCVIGIASTTSVNSAYSDGSQFAGCEIKSVDASKNITGRVVFTQVDNTTISVTASVCGLPSANQTYGFHIHTFGDLSGANAASNIGSHFNPFNASHGLPPSTSRHLGDMYNLKTDTSGKAVYSATLDMSSLGQLPISFLNSIVGRAVAIHANTDDGVTQPSGNSGDKIATCVIGITSSATDLSDIVCAPLASTTPTPTATPSVSPSLSVVLSYSGLLSALSAVFLTLSLL